MKVINISQSTIFLDDINLAVIYSRKKLPFEIDDSLARKSKNLRWVLKEGMLIDVTQGIPNNLPEPACETEYAAVNEEDNNEPKSLYHKRKELLASADPILKKPTPRTKQRPQTLGVLEDYEKNGNLSVIWTGPACFTKDAPINTPKGLIPINKINIGDLVFSHKQILRPVINIFKRPYKGKMIVITSSGYDIQITPDHKVFVVRKDSLDIENIPAEKLTTDCLLFSPLDYSPYAKISNIDKQDFEGYVYNIEVEEDHSYLVDGKAVKNCDAGGYALMNRKFMLGLSQRGVNLKYDMLASMNDMDPKTNDDLKKLQATEVPQDAPKVYGMTAPLHYSWERYKCLFTMMETRRLHPDYVERCNCADELIVPTYWCKRTFEESGVKKPISVVPLGVDTKIFKPDAEPLDFSSRLKDYVFLSVFGWSMRKGYDVLLKAYLEEFTSDDPVSLLISARYFGSTDESKKQVIRDDVARISSMVANPKKPHLVLFGDVLSMEMMPRLYASADCYVLPTRGEGYSLPALESGACGLPVITTRYSGQTDFLDNENSYLLDVDGFKRADDSIAWISYFYEDQEFPILGPTVVEQLRAYMRHVYENQEEAKYKAGKLHEKVVKDYDWEICVDKMHDKLKAMYAELRRKND